MKVTLYASYRGDLPRSTSGPDEPLVSGAIMIIINSEHSLICPVIAESYVRIFNTRDITSGTGPSLFLYVYLAHFLQSLCQHVIGL